MPRQPIEVVSIEDRREPPTGEVARRPSWFVAAVLAMLLLSLLLEVRLYRAGFLAVGPDASALTLRAETLTVRGDLAPRIVPPFVPLVNGLALRVHPDLVRTPRVLSGLFGVLATGAVMLLAWHMFRCHAVVLISGLLAAFLPFRLVLAVVPLPGIYYAFWYTTGAAFTAAWLRDSRPRDLTLACVTLAIGSTVLYQGWLASFALVMILCYVGLAVRREPLVKHVPNLLILTAFPLLWFLLALIAGGFGRFVHDPGGFPYLRLQAGWALVWKALGYQFFQQAMASPLVAGLAALGFYWFRSSSVRVWTLLLIVPLAGMSVMALLTGYVPMHDYWVQAAPSLLLLVPFLARLLHLTGETVLPGSRARVLMTATAAACFAAGFYAASNDWIGRSDFTRNDRQTGTFLGQLARGRDGRILIDSAGWNDLHVMVASGVPDRFVRNIVSDHGHAEPPVIDPVKGIDMEELHRRNISVLALDQTRDQQLVEASGAFRLLQEYGSWRIYYLPSAKTPVEG